MNPTSLTDAACAVLNAAAPEEKVALSHRFAASWRDGGLHAIGDTRPPLRPARPALPELKAPREVKRRRGGGSLANRIALLHAIAHIELNAIDLAWDLIARFACPDLPQAFFGDWVAVADEEASHHALIAHRLGELGAFYGDLPAHDGLWEAAQATAHDLLEPIQKVVESDESDVIHCWAPEFLPRGARCGSLSTAAPPIGAACVTQAI